METIGLIVGVIALILVVRSGFNVPADELRGFEVSDGE